jgi:hypothetical protein
VYGWQAVWFLQGVPSLEWYHIENGHCKKFLKGAVMAIGFEVSVQNSHKEGFWFPHEVWEWSDQRFDTLSEAVCASLPLVDKNDNVIISIVTFDPSTPHWTTAEVVYDFFHGKMSHRANKYQH